MLTSILFLLKRLWLLIRDHWQIALGIVVLLVVTVFLYRACDKRSTNIDQATVNKINAANEAERKKELQKVIEDNADVIRTVDNRSTVAETNVVERDRLIAEKIKEADKAIAEAKKQGRDVTQSELECILVPENCQ